MWDGWDASGGAGKQLGVGGKGGVSPTRQPHGLEDVGMGRAGGDEVLLQQEAGDLHDGAEGPLEDSLCPVAGQGAGRLDQFVPRGWCDLGAHLRLQWQGGKETPSQTKWKGA